MANLKESKCLSDVWFEVPRDEIDDFMETLKVSLEVKENGRISVTLLNVFNPLSTKDRGTNVFQMIETWNHCRSFSKKYSNNQNISSIIKYVTSTQVSAVILKR